MSNNGTSNLGSEWVEKADEDLASLKSLLYHKEGSASTCCFLAQQVIEKLFKAILTFHNVEIKKTHDLVALLNQIKKFELDIDKFSDIIPTITRYYIETRYPGDYPEFSWKECQEAYEIANKIRDFVADKIKTSS